MPITMSGSSAPVQITNDTDVKAAEEKKAPEKTANKPTSVLSGPKALDDLGKDTFVKAKGEKSTKTKIDPAKAEILKKAPADKGAASAKKADAGEKMKLSDDIKKEAVVNENTKEAVPNKTVSTKKA